MAEFHVVCWIKKKKSGDGEEIIILVLLELEAVAFSSCLLFNILMLPGAKKTGLLHMGLHT